MMDHRTYEFVAREIDAIPNDRPVIALQLNPEAAAHLHGMATLCLRHPEISEMPYAAATIRQIAEAIVQAYERAGMHKLAAEILRNQVPGRKES